MPAASYNHTALNSTITNQDQRFWKEYIDFVLGVWCDPNGNVQTPGSSTCSYGPDFACGDGTGVSISGPDSGHEIQRHRPSSLRPTTRCARGIVSGSGR